MSKMFWAILSVIVLLLVGVFIIANRSSTSNVDKVENPQEITANDHSEGPANAKVTIIEYGDFQCPACAATYPNVAQLRTEYADKVRFVFRHFPLTNIHPNAMAASRAAEAAGKQGKFFEMHDVLYEKQKEWSTDIAASEKFEEYAKELGLNIDQFISDVNSSEVSDAINLDIATGKQLGVDGTPAFYLNGTKIQTPKTFAEFKAKIDEALNKN